jgi:hypothetical protein
VPHLRLRLFRQLHEVDQLLGGRTLAVEGAEHPHDLARRHPVGELALLQLHAQALADGRLVAVPAHPQDLHLAAVGALQPFEHLDGRGLPRAVGAQQAKALAAPHLQVKRAHRHRLPEALVQGAAADGGRGGIRISRHRVEDADCVAGYTEAQMFAQPVPLTSQQSLQLTQNFIEEIDLVDIFHGVSQLSALLAELSNGRLVY